jgi:cytochrome c
MKSIVIAAVVAVGLVAAGAANAQEDAAKKAGCLTCHSVDTKKMGPAFKDVAAKYKGKADAAATLQAKLEGAKGHPEVKVKGDDLAGVIKWVLSL